MMQRKSIITMVMIIILVIGMVLNLSIGSTFMSLKTIFNAIVADDHSKDALIINTIRLPRLFVAIMVGISLAVGGAIMQALTKNALASPQTFVINAGAALLLVASIVYLPGHSDTINPYIAFLGAIVGGLIVYTFIYGHENNHVRLALAGMTIHLLLSSITEVLIILNENSTDVLYWLTSSLNGKDWDGVQILLPWFVIGVSVALFLAKDLTVLSLGDIFVTSLGLHKKLKYLIFSFIVIILAGSSVAVAGPIAFIGLIAPHISRRLIGGGYEKNLYFTALTGAVILVYADTLSHIIAYPYESPVGIVTALIGGPFFLYLCKNGRSGLK